MPANLLLAAPAFLVTIVGVAIALTARQCGPVAGALAIAVALGIGFLADWLGKRALPRYPKFAVICFTVWFLCPAIAAATFIAIIIYLNTEFDTEALGVTGLDKELLKTTLTAVVALLTATSIKMMDDADEKVVGAHVRNAFENRFRDSNDKPFPGDAYPVILGQSPLEEPVFGTVIGWGWKERWLRASEIAKSISNADEINRVAAFRTALNPPPAPAPGTAPAAAGETAAKPAGE